VKVSTYVITLEIICFTKGGGLFSRSVNTGGRLRYRIFKNTIEPDMKAANYKKPGVSGSSLVYNLT
jgi:hypothetical protein